jgi:hypothetical protein
MSDIERPTDSDLVAAYRAGDPDAFAEIYDRYSDRVFSYFLSQGGSRTEAADGTNDAFTEASRRLDIRESPDDLERWLLGIAATLSGDVAGHVEVPQPNELIAAPPALRPRVLDKVDRDVVSALSMGNLDPEMKKIGLFVVVTVIVGLIGLAVSAQFEPLQVSPVVPEARAPVVSSTTTTSIPGSSTSTDPGQDSTSSTAEPEPAAISVSTENVDFGEDGTGGEFELTNAGGQSGQWEITSSSDAVVLSAGSGELGPGESVTIELMLDRENIQEGDLEESLTVTLPGGQQEIAVTGSHEDIPVIHNPQATPPSVQVSGDSECTNNQTRISARVRDTSPLESVVARWSPDGGPQRETAMESVGDDMFEVVVGPFTVVGTTEVRIVAFDERGNAGGASAQVAVTECP